MFLKLVQIVTVHLSFNIFGRRNEELAPNIFYEESHRTLEMGDGSHALNDLSPPTSDALTPYVVGDSTSSASSTEIREVSSHHRRQGQGISLLEHKVAQSSSNSDEPSSKWNGHHHQKKKSSRRTRTARISDTGALTSSFHDAVSVEMKHDPF